MSKPIAQRFSPRWLFQSLMSSMALCIVYNIILYTLVDREIISSSWLIDVILILNRIFTQKKPLDRIVRGRGFVFKRKSSPAVRIGRFMIIIIIIIIRRVHVAGCRHRSSLHYYNIIVRIKHNDVKSSSVPQLPLLFDPWKIKTKQIKSITFYFNL